MIETNEKKTVYVTDSYDEWRDVVKETAKHVLPDKIVFAEELKNLPIKYMTNPVASYNGNMLAVCSYTASSFGDAINYIEKMCQDFSVFVYRMQWRYVTVDGYTINDVTIHFATAPKEDQ